MILLLVTSVLFTGQSLAVLPPIAKVCRIYVGSTGPKAQIQKLDDGLVTVGGHSNSGRIWKLFGGAFEVRTDGFSLGPDGYVTEGIAIETTKPTLGPEVDLTWVGMIRLWMPRQLIQKLSAQLLPPKRNGGSWEWGQSGYTEPQFRNGQNPFQT